MSNKVRIAGAVGLGVIIIAVAFGMSDRGIANQGALVIAAPARSPIEVADVDQNGTPDWEQHLAENVFATVAVPSSSSTAQAEPYTPPTTLTGKFSEAFIQDYLQGKMNGVDFSDPTAFTNTAVAAIERNTQSVRHTTADIAAIVPTTQESARAYGNTLQEIAIKHSLPGENEMIILKRALDQKDPEILEALTPIERGYARIIRDTLLVPVPDALVIQHIAILDAYEGILADILAAEKAFDDPLLTLARTRDYDVHASALLYAYASLAQTLVKMGVVYSSNEPGAFYRSFESVVIPQ
jgi:hypothetical protein